MLNSRHSALFALSLALGACAPAAPVATAPAPAPPPAPPAVADGPEVAPDDWWLLDPTSDAVYGTSAQRAYRELLANQEPRRSVVVAIIDSGVDIEHEDLDDNLWVNVDEVPGNGADDDENGYVDDVHGWSFLGGPGGDVHHDTYEVTRLYVGCRERNETASPSCQAIAADFEAKRAEAAGLLAQYRNIDMALERFTALLEAHLGTDSLTRSAVAGIQTARGDLVQAQQAWLQLHDAGATPKVIDDGIESLSNQLEYGLNPEFDPRPIVGDDYADPTERDYGTNNVEGPAAEHGTHVAGIVGAERGNGVGVNGIAPGPELMIIRAVPDGDERDKDVANAIRYATDNGAHIINMSFGKGYSPGKAIVDEAVRHAEQAGVLIVHAAGNESADVGQEDNFPNRYYESGGQAQLWIEVGASEWTDPESLAASFSNYNQQRVDVFAPGVEILSTVPDDQYERNQGTSMAAPVVSGLAALIMAYYPGLDARQVKEIILETATRYAQPVLVPGGEGARRPFGELSVTGGVVNAYEALKRAAAVAGR